MATCESRGINPFEYLADVLARVQDQLASDVDALLPAAWMSVTTRRPSHDAVLRLRGHCPRDLAGDGARLHGKPRTPA